MHRSDLYDRINSRMACKEQYKETFLRPNLHEIFYVEVDRFRGRCLQKEEKKKKERRPIFLNNDSKIRLGYMKFANML